MYRYHNSISRCWDPCYPPWRNRYCYREPFLLGYDYGYGYPGGRYGYDDWYY